MDMPVYIVVDGSYSEEMIKLGYEMTTMKYWDNDILTDDRIVMVCIQAEVKMYLSEKR